MTQTNTSVFSVKDMQFYYGDFHGRSIDRKPAANGCNTKGQSH